MHFNNAFLTMIFKTLLAMIFFIISIPNVIKIFSRCDVTTQPPPQPSTPAPQPPPPPQSARSVTPPVPVRCQFKIGDNCLAQFKGSWYLAQVFDFNDDNGKYSVYFPSDGEELKNVRPKSLREAPRTSPPPRHKFQNKEFYFDGDDTLASGRWKVRRTMHGKNSFVCARVTGGGRKNIEEFDIGYVMRQIQKEDEGFRENGPMWIPPGR